jgi:beta-glucosidase-like glycosyl hydrolase
MKLIASVTATLVLLSGMAYAQSKPAAPATTAPAQHAASSTKPTAAAQSKLLPYQDSRLPVEQRITDLIQRMTLDEKLAMLGTDPTIPRLGIVGTNHVEGLHGLALGGPGGWGGRGLVTPTTQFPQSHGLGQTWDPELL